jgi:hypothetical protein
MNDNTEKVTKEEQHKLNAAIAHQRKYENIRQLKMSKKNSTLLKKIIDRRFKRTGKDEKTITEQDIQTLMMLI